MAPWCALKVGVTPLRDGDKISRHLSQCDIPVVALARRLGITAHFSSVNLFPRFKR